MLYKKRCDNVLILYDKHKVTFKTVQRQYLLTLWGRPLQRRVRRVSLLESERNAERWGKSTKCPQVFDSWVTCHGSQVKVSGQPSLLVCVLYQHTYPSKGYDLSNPALKSQSASAETSTHPEAGRGWCCKSIILYSSISPKWSESIFYLILIECKMNPNLLRVLFLDWSI